MFPSFSIHFPTEVGIVAVYIYIYTKENNIDIIYIYTYRVYAMLSTTPSFPRDFRYSIHVPSPSDALA